MKNVPKHVWLIPLLAGVVGACAFMQLRSAEAEKVVVVPAALGGGSPGSITDDPTVRKCICKLWQKGGYGFLPTEAGMDIVRSKEGRLSCRFWPFSNMHQRAEPPGKWPLDDVTAAVHTHPRKGTVQYPTDPDDYMNSVDNYVVCADGVFSARKGCTKEKDKRSCTQQPGGGNWRKEWCGWN